MRDDVLPPTDVTARMREDVLCTLYDTGTPLDLILGTGGLTTRDLTPYVSGLEQTEAGATVRLGFPGTEFSGSNKPAIGRLVQLSAPSFTIANFIVDSITGEKESRGEREITLNLRSRDALPKWRDVRLLAPNASVGVELSNMARSLVSRLGLASQEIVLPSTGIYLAQGAIQLADQNSWDMLTKMLEPALLEPYVDVLGRFRAISRDVNRTPDMTLSAGQIISEESGTARPPITIFRVKWLDPTLSESPKQPQMLGATTLSLGFFNPTPSNDVWFSEDHKQRARDLQLVIKQSVNNLFTIGSEGMDVEDAFHVNVNAALSVWNIGMLAALSAAFAGSTKIPDGVATAGLLTQGGQTVPVGRITEGIALLALLQFITHQSVGSYEVWGTPYDYVQAVNEVEAYDVDADEWMTKTDETQNDLIPNETVAEQLAINELIYRAREADPTTLIVADDFRIERGDVLGAPDGRAYYVKGYARDLTRGAPAILKLNGFWL